MHPSNPKKYVNDYSAEGLRHNGFVLRNYLALLKYAEVIEKVLPQKPVRPAGQQNDQAHGRQRSPGRYGRLTHLLIDT